MQKPEYELGPLKAGVIQAKLNIAAFERGVLQESDRIKEYQRLIAKWDEYNRWLKENGDNIKSGKSVNHS